MTRPIRAADQKHLWHLSVHGRRHRVEVTGSVSRTVSWYVDDQLTAVKKSAADTISLKPGDGLDATREAAAREQPQVGTMTVKSNALGRVKRVTWQYAGEGARGALGAGGIDLDPEPGSPAARREERIRRHPRRYAAVAVVGGLAKVVVPLLLGLLAVRLAVSIPWPDWSLPSIPWPDIDLPSVPLPDVDAPSIPLPDIELPAWVEWILDNFNYVWPVLLAWGLARSELKRRRRQDELKAKLKADAEKSAASPPAGPEETPHQEAGQDARA